jgi:predicted metal-binding protein
MNSRTAARQLADVARRLGAAAAAVMPAHRVVVDPRVRLKCQVPLCPHYGHNLVCPPAVPSPQEFTRSLRRYRWAVVVLVAGRLSGGDGDRMEQADELARDLYRVLASLEARALQLGFPLACGLAGGHCRLCPTCVGQKSGQMCPRPFQPRPAAEALGVDVVATARRAGIELTFPVSDCVQWVGLLLL